ncbi:very short patch repair endonuclease [Pelagibacterium halotolerans]|uniref:very short patch repair endonuclease n=1 Tax=Pelagibacterium halotolerans TaxID=531813 RepID=UPI00384FFCE0
MNKSRNPVDVDPSRSALMARVRQKGSAPEMVVRRISHALGFRHRLHRASLPGSPDLVFPSRKAVIFVHGCFWHRHDGCPRSTTPKTRREYWEAKFRDNVARDRRVMMELQRQGWSAMVIWECETRDQNLVAKKVDRFLRSCA